MPHPVARTFLEAARLICSDQARQGNCLHFDAGEEIILTGDIHGHRANLAKIIAYADLPAHPNRRLVLQEMIHGGPMVELQHSASAGRSGEAAGDRSVETLLRAARLKLSYPHQVFFLMGNHDLAQLAGGEITKEGLGVCKAFDAGLDAMFGEDAPEVRSAVNQMLRNQPLAGRCANGAFLSHSLPSPDRMSLVDWEILQRAYRDEDFRRGGSVYEWTWGKGHTKGQLAEIADRVEAGLFLLGHQHIKTGYEIQLDRIVILASNHAHGSVMVFDAGADLPAEALTRHIKPIVAL